MSNRVKAIVLPGPHQELELREIPLPDLEPGSMLMQPIFSEVCGTDVHLLHGRLAGVPYPIIPGHVSVGRIAKLRGHVADIYGVPFAEGDVITFLDVHETCGNCWHCLVGKNTTRCPSRKVYGITYSANEGLLGGWAESVYLKPGVKAIRIPPTLDPAAFIGGGCGAPTAFHAVQRAAIKLNDTVLVQGTGPVGLSCIAFARISGAGTVIAIGAPDDRLALARKMGADVALNVESTNPEDRKQTIAKLTQGRGVDVAIEATGNPVAVPEGMDLTRDAGTYVIVGQYTDCGGVEINPHTLINRKHLDVRGCWGSDYSHFHGAVEAMTRHHGSYAWHTLAQWQYPLESAAQALQDIEARKVPKAVIKIS